MTRQVLTERAADFGEFARITAAGQSPFTLRGLEHVYIRIDFKHKYENARTAEDARSFLRSVARASMAAHHLAEHHGGWLLEVQGSMLHVALPLEERGGLGYVADLHSTYCTIFGDRGSRVDGWRMTIDGGNTLVVAGHGIHRDDSYVSLGTAANRPAKYLYAQLELPEGDRDLKRFHVGIRDSRTGQWHHKSLNETTAILAEAKAIAETARMAEPRLDFVDVSAGWRRAEAQAAPIGPAGSPSSPSAARPHTYFGWVMRADLDGFTARVEECFDHDQRLAELAAEFYQIMGAAAQFADSHRETLAQLPWAGDNFTAAVVFGTKDEYDDSLPKRLVELSLDFEKEMAEPASEGGFGGWAHGVAGGEVRGNTGGNVYLAGVEVGGRRFLVGAGEGFGRSAQAFGDINPKPNQMVLHAPDWARLDEEYRNEFEQAITRRGETSTLYHVAHLDDLWLVRGDMATRTKVIAVSAPGGESREVAIKPHHR